MLKENDSKYFHLKEKSGIYKIVNKVNSKIYVGSAINLYRRRQEHRAKLLNEYHFNQHLTNAFRKYGIENFTFEVIEILEDVNSLIEREQFWIDKLNAYENGYNLSKIANSRKGSTVSLETKNKISETLKDYMNSLSEEEKDELYKNRGILISKAKLAKNHKMSDEAKKKMSIAKTGIKLGERPQEVKEKISKSKMGHKNTPIGSDNWNSVLDEDTVIKIKEMIVEGISVKKISDDLNVHTSLIYAIRSGASWSHILPELNLSQYFKKGRLSDEQVKEVKIMLLKGIKQKDIATMLGISKSTVSKINKNESFKDIKIEEVV